MQKFAICIVKDNDQKIVSTHMTKDEAIKNGNTINSQLPKGAGVVSCIFGEFDDNDNLIGNKYKIHKTWI